ncbi:MFS general substrate transporter [Aspergillus lucknowensis]|uniref:MFS general substrate transporter n=1 Tax=Aspergillus lucknowensis TaxID=176173 RepID=A0ABR4L8H6_9EURO
MTADAPWGYRWRSSQLWIIATATISLFSETFLFGFIVPILPYMLETRLGLDPSRTQNFTTTLLTVYGVISLVAAPFIAHFADKTPNRKGPLLLSLAACASGTVLVACSSTVWVLMAGQALQALASSSVWIVAFATLVDSVSEENKGTVVGSTISMVGTGMFAGPMVSGTLLQLLGYWPTWSAALLLLAVDFLARLLMIERPAVSHEDERTALLAEDAGDPDANATSDPADTSKDPPRRGFYSIMLTNAHILASLLNTLALSLILSAFDTTLPLHVRDVFGWGSLPVGLLFLGLQAPNILLGAAIGWLRDRVGLRWPTTLGWALLAPLLWLLAVPGEQFVWGRLEPGTGGEAVYVAAIVGVGFAMALTRGAGTFQMMAVVHDLEAKDPNIFGPYGGNSRLSGLTELPFNIGMIAGPLLSGVFSEVLGYYYANSVLGEFYRLF